MSRNVRLTLATVALCSVCFGDVLAQQPPAKPAPKEDQPKTEPRDPADPMADARRPYTGVFGGASVEAEPTNGLRVNGSLFGVWDQNLLVEVAGPNISSALNVGGFYTNAVADVNYARRTTRTQLGVSGGANARYYTNLGRFIANDYHGGLGVSVRPTRLTTVSMSQALSYSPVFLFGIFNDVLPRDLGNPGSPDTTYAVTDDRAVTTDTTSELEHRFTPRLMFSGRGAYRRSHYLVVTPRGSDFTRVDGGGGFRYRLSEDSDLRLEYVYRAATFAGTEQFGLPPQQPAEHNLNVGMAFHPRRTEQRRTTVTFEGGTSIVRSALPTDFFQTRRQLRLVGDIAVAHQMQRTWLLVGAFKRGTGFIQGLGAPVFTDNVSLTASGFFNPRTDFLASVAYSNGEPSLVGATVNFTTATANARLRVALTPRWAFTSEYFFYHYDFSRVIALAPGIEPRFKRNTFRAGLTFWTPVQR